MADLDVKGGVVLGEGHEVGKLRGNLTREAVEVGLRERAGHLTSAIGAEVEEDDGVAIGYALVLAGKRLDELITAVVGGVRGLDASMGAGLTVERLGDDVVGKLDALPAVIAVHGVITARNGGDAGIAAVILGDVGRKAENSSM